MEQIITSTLDTDFYKLTMGQAVVQLFPRVKVKYSFFNRGNTHFPTGFGAELRRQIDGMSKIGMQDKGDQFLHDTCKFLNPSFIEYFKNFRYDPSVVGVIQNKGELTIQIEGYWRTSINWEVSLMALISELYFKMTGEKIHSRKDREINNHKKANLYRTAGMSIADFGTRRRYSRENQEEVLKDYISCDYEKDRFLVGTSNVMFAQQLGLKPIGTKAHEWYSFHGAMYGYKMANNMAMDNWVRVYEGDLGIALPDTFTDEVFLKTFGKKLAKLYDGLRHDSGDPIDFTTKFVKHYLSLGINPENKQYVYSNGLDYIEAYELHKKLTSFKVDGKIYSLKPSFGIGTNTTNDVGVTPLNMVIKMVEAQIYPNIEGPDGWTNVIKLGNSDSGKNTGDKNEIDIAKKILRLI